MLSIGPEFSSIKATVGKFNLKTLSTTGNETSRIGLAVRDTMDHIRPKYGHMKLPCSLEGQIQAAFHGQFVREFSATIFLNTPRFS
ncbi:hypothetical protein AMTR_s00020p00052100 [Amborella trichopoda]|uniref:Uncharacterized protein n=1 Tax=Amborella trichopoda TaxID=13333 RepID=W1PVI4_AMBTC|nr:hypothetical protein AMTR_s00020p00052100 [Amborella trichopoda]